MGQRIVELRRKRQTAVDEARKLADTAEMTDEIRGQVDAKLAEVDAIDKDIAREQRMMQASASRVQVTGDRADRALAGNPFRGFGEYLMAVVRAGRGEMDERLLPLRSKETDDEGGFQAERVADGGRIQVGWGTEPEQRATGMSEGSASQAGFLVGTDKASTLIERVYDVGSLLGRVAMDPISGGSNSMVYYAEDETSRAAGYRRGGIRAYWAAEAGTVTASAPKFREIELKLKKAMAIVYATSELLSDASTLESYILRNLPEELRYLVEDSIINGTGTGQPLGLVNCGALVSVTKESGQAADTVVAQNVMKAYARMWTRGLRSGVWLISQDVWPQLFQMNVAVGTGGQPVFLPPGGLSAAPYGSLMGRPIEPVEYCPKLGDLGDILFFDPTQYQMIQKGGVDAASSIHVKFTYDESCFRFIWRVDGAPLWYSALTPANGGSTVSPYIGIAAR